MSRLQVLYFTAHWCAPCKAMAPTIAQAESIVPIQKIDVTRNASITAQYNVTSVPTFIFTSNGQEVKRVVGAVGLSLFQSMAKLYS